MIYRYDPMVVTPSMIMKVDLVRLCIYNSPQLCTLTLTNKGRKKKEKRKKKKEKRRRRRRKKKEERRKKKEERRKEGRKKK